MKVIVIIGALCSGKTTFVQQFNQEDVVEIGQIVRDLTLATERVFDKDLDVAINNRVFQIISKRFHCSPSDLYIVGIRQLSILEGIQIVCKDLGIPVEITYLEVPDAIRKQRYINRNAFKDSYIDFDLADQKDKELGLKELIEALIFNSSVKKIKNY